MAREVRRERGAMIVWFQEDERLVMKFNGMR